MSKPKLKLLATPDKTRPEKTLIELNLKHSLEETIAAVGDATIITTRLRLDIAIQL